MELETKIGQMLRQATEKNASDLHLKVGHLPTIRVEGELRPMDGSELTAQDTERIAAALMPPPRAAQLAERGETDFAYELDGVGRFRVNAFRQQETVALVLRRVLPSVPTLEELGLPPVVRRLADEPNGLVLVTGSTGSGKSTTLASMIDQINRSRAAHVVTIEDPVEIRHRDVLSLVTQREVGTDTADFRSALTMVLRQDPDVILIGEMRDAETVWAALAAAETGHLVLSSLHTVNATESVNRVLEFFPTGQHLQVRSTLAASLRGIVSQRLLPSADRQGRVPAVEVLVGTGRVFDRIVAPERTHELEEVIAQGAYYGMQTFDQDVVRLFREGAITRQTAIGAATRPHDVRLVIDGLEGAEAVARADAWESSPVP